MSFLTLKAFLSRVAYIYQEALGTYIYVHHYTSSGPGTGRGVSQVGGHGYRQFYEENRTRSCSNSRLCGTSNASKHRIGEVGGKRHNVWSYRANGRSPAYRGWNPPSVHRGIRTFGPREAWVSLSPIHEGSRQPSLLYLTKQLKR